MIGSKKGQKLLEPTDPRYQYLVGVLVGAAEMMASYMKLHGDEKAQGMAARVDSVLEHFTDSDTAQIGPVWENDV